jgi:hypothetical protein
MDRREAQALVQQARKPGRTPLDRIVDTPEELFRDHRDTMLKYIRAAASHGLTEAALQLQGPDLDGLGTALLDYFKGRGYTAQVQIHTHRGKKPVHWLLISWAI